MNLSESLPPFLRGSTIDATIVELSSALDVSVAEGGAQAPALYRALSFLPESSAQHGLVQTVEEARASGYGGQVAVFEANVADELRAEIFGRAPPSQCLQLADSLRVLSREPAFAPALETLIALVICAPRPFFGSHRAALGVIFAGPCECQSSWELEQLLAHELVHQALFLHEVRCGIFSGRAVFAYSAVMSRARPYDLAFHAAFVAWVLAARAYAHQRFVESAFCLQRLAAALPELDRLSAMALDPQGRELLCWLQDHFQYSWVIDLIAKTTPDSVAQYAHHAAKSYLTVDTD